MRHLHPCLFVGRIEAFFADFTLGEECLGVTHAAQLQAFHSGGLKTLSDNKFGTAATDIDYQAAGLVVSQRMGDAEIHQTGFLSAVDHVDGYAQNPGRWFGKRPSVLGSA